MLIGGLKDVADLMGVTSKQVYMWHQRREKNGFPEAVAQVHLPRRPGDKRKAPLFDLEAVVDWYANYDPRARTGKHWQEKRGDGVPPKNRSKKTQEEWRRRQGIEV